MENDYEGVTHAGLAVVAVDTGRVLLAQRALDETDDPEVQETWELPGGGLEEGEDPQAGALREFREETGIPLEGDFEVVNGWRAGPEENYQGFVVVIPSEGEPPSEWFEPNDEVQALAWVTQDSLDESMTIRPEMADFTAPPWTLIDDVALGVSGDKEIDMPDLENPEPETPDLPPEEEEDEPDARPPVPGPLRGHGVLAPEDTWSGDRRKFSAGSLRQRDLPLPITWQKVTTAAHDNATTVFKIEKIERIDNLIHYSGIFIDNEEADEVTGLIAEFGRFGVSIDADDIGDFEFNEETQERVIHDARISGASIVHIPAFQEAYIALGPHPILDAEEGLEEEEPLPEDTTPMEDDQALSLIASAVETYKRGAGWVTHPEETRRLHRYWTEPGQPGFIKIGWGKNGSNGDFASCVRHVGAKIAQNSPEDLRYIKRICAEWHHDALGIWPGQKMHNLDPLEHALTSEGDDIVITAAAIPKYDPAFFANPGLTEPTGVTVTEDGHVYGHIATWGVCHIGIQRTCVTAPRSKTDYAYFTTGLVHLTDGDTVEVGTLTAETGHADMKLGAFAAASHYDDTGTGWADVTCGEDEIGIWFSGRVRDHITDAQLGEIIASGRLSGDWRQISGNLELVAALTVNSGGFPIPRGALVAGSQTTLVAAGVVQDEKPAAGETQADVAERAALRAVEIIEARAARRERAAALREQYAPLAEANRADRIMSLRARYQEV